MDNRQLQKSTLSNLAWRFAERCGAKGVSFVVSIVLARILEPSAYGSIALITVITTILNVFVDSGLGNALIQKKDADELDFSTVFYFNVVLCLVLYGLLFVVAPIIANFYEDSSLIWPIRALGLTIVISGIKNIQQAYVSRELIFRKFFFATLGGTIVAAVVGISMAYLGFGLWALVAQQIVNAAIDTTILFIVVPWRPKRMFSFQRLKGLFSYGSKLLAVALVDTIYNDIRQLVIGKVYSSSDLAYYNRGKQVPELVVYNIDTSIDSVIFPVMSKEQDNLGRIKSITRRSIKTSTYIMAPMMIGLVAVAEPFVKLLLTEKWLPCVLYLRVFCITYMFYPIQTANTNAIKSVGRSDLLLKLDLMKKGVGVVSILIAVFVSVEAMAYSLLVTTVINQIIITWPNKKLMDYGYMEQLKDIMPGILLAAGMGLCVYPISFLGLSDILTLIIQVVLGVAIYVGGSILFKMESFHYILDMIKPYIRKRVRK